MKSVQLGPYRTDPKASLNDGPATSAFPASIISQLDYGIGTNGEFPQALGQFGMCSKTQEPTGQLRGAYRATDVAFAAGRIARLELRAAGADSMDQSSLMVMAVPVQMFATKLWVERAVAARRLAHENEVPRLLAIAENRGRDVTMDIVREN